MDLVSGVSTRVTRQRLKVGGIVQGVGFRPFVYGLASSLELAGFVLNNGEGVIIEVEGAPERLQTFGERLRQEPPPLARVEHVSIELLSAHGEKTFDIVQSRAGAQRSTLVAPDAATCDDCLRELLDPDDRRYLYPFINCTNCGPRFTIIQDLPYDRDKTTMRPFPMCPTCRREYEDPLDRRFHAQPNACAECGPGVSVEYGLWGVACEHSSTHVPNAVGAHTSAQQWGLIREAAHLLAHGCIVAVKGLGGYHLACDAFNGEAVAALRRLKRRRAKPFALMAPDLEAARGLCYVGDVEAALLQSRRRPIILLSRREDTPVAPEVAPGYDSLGLMLPYTPLHTLLLHFFAKEKDAPGPLALVMTSANVSNEPIIYQDSATREKFANTIHILSHNRGIHSRCDDSVVRIVADAEQLLRRSRGYAPEPIRLAHSFPVPLLACGAHLKNTFCLGKGNQVFLSQHIGDLENMETMLAYRQTIDHFKVLFDVEPEVIVHDLHPEYLASKYANDLPGRKIGVQHHHAHVASVLAEHGLDGPVIGVAADGAGYGPDGAIWGGEVLIVDLRSGHKYPGYRRVAHLAYAPLPGGEQAVRQPWRVAAAQLRRAFGPQGFQQLDILFLRELDRQRWSTLEQMIERGLNSPPTSSLGRLFDAVASLLCLRHEVDYEGQAAVELEMLARRCPAPEVQAYSFTLTPSEPDSISLLEPAPIIRAIVADVQADTSPALIAARFHETVAHMLRAACNDVRRKERLQRVALSGGVFQNRLLLERLMQLLQTDGFETYTNRRVPPNDGGLSLGQAAVAAARMCN